VPSGSFVKLEDVAQHAGVSLATASRVLNGGSHRGRADLRARVLVSAEALGYVPNPHARALASATSDTIGLVVQDVRDPYFAVVAGGAIEVANEHGFLVTIVCTYRDPQQETKYVSMLRAQRVRAIILAGSAYEAVASTRAMAQELDAYCNAGGAVVSITRHRLPGDTVLVENRAGAQELARSLVELGHRKFAVLSGPKRLTTSRDRLAGFEAGLGEFGLSLLPEFVIHSDFDRDGGYEAAKRLLRLTRCPTCVFAANDAMALGALAAFREAGISVPGDVSLAGFGDIPAARDSVPALSTVHLPLDALGAEAMRLALRSDRAGGAQKVTIAGDVVLRESTARVARKKGAAANEARVNASRDSGRVTVRKPARTGP
jgi:LacI family transcriptional regulator